MSYNDIKDKTNFEDVMLKYGFALEMLETELKILIKDYEYTNKCSIVDHFKSRLKSEDSVINKLGRKGYDVTTYNIIHHIHDMIGIRVVCSFLPEVYEIVDLIKNSKQFTIKEEKDYIMNPKDTGYISYHLIILVPVYLMGETVEVEAEIQIRTMAMDFWASLDHKISYKFKDILPDEVKHEMYNCSKDIKQIDEKMNNLKEISKKYKD